LGERRVGLSFVAAGRAETRAARPRVTVERVKETIFGVLVEISKKKWAWFELCVMFVFRYS
jgi:RNase H-fold protein (predicted Holliday junction resolvase)